MACVKKDATEVTRSCGKEEKNPLVVLCSRLKGDRVKDYPLSIVGPNIWSELG